MQPLDPTIQQAADIYWLAFLLTSDREVSLDVSVEASRSGDLTHPFFQAWMQGWSRKVVIAKALAAIREELAASARRTKARKTGNHAVLPRNWALSPDTSRVQLERALLAIDEFPRCALLLSVFEGLSMDDSIILLDEGRDLIRKAKAIGLQELTSNLAEMQNRTAASILAPGPIAGMQHA